MSDRDPENLRDKLADREEEILDYVERNSPRPSADKDMAERLLTEAPPDESAAELKKMVDGFRSGAGSATGRRTEPVPGVSPTEDL